MAENKPKPNPPCDEHKKVIIESLKAIESVKRKLLTLVK
jgi:hypothetical protein